MCLNILIKKIISVTITLLFFHKFPKNNIRKLNNYIVIKPTGGLCNYLRVVFSYYKYAKSINSELIVIWNKTRACNGYFLDYFESIEGIQILEDKNIWMKLYNMSFIDKIYYKGCSVHPNHSPDYTKLKLLPHINNIVRNKIHTLENNYIAVHIRRTDHIQLAKKNNIYTTDAEFINFIDKFKCNKNLYISTDNKKTYDIFCNKYNKIVKFNYHTVIMGKRKTELVDAIIDIYICKYADNFMGSGYSSFTDIIKQLRFLVI